MSMRKMKRLYNQKFCGMSVTNYCQQNWQGYENVCWQKRFDDRNLKSKIIAGGLYFI